MEAASSTTVAAINLFTAIGRMLLGLAALVLGALMLGLVAYEVFWFMGYVRAPPCGWFKC